MVSMQHIQQLGRQIGRQFAPERVMLFGSYADGTATDDSDVDLLVIMPFEGRAADKSAEVRLALHPSFPVDVLVRTPQTVRQRVSMGDGFLADILEHGKVLYEADRG